MSLLLSVFQVSERCSVLSSSEMTCPTPKVTPEVKVKGLWFQLDNVRVHYESIKVPVSLLVRRCHSKHIPAHFIYLSVPQGQSFAYYPNPEFFPLIREPPDVPYRFKPGGVIAVEVNMLFTCYS